MKLLSVISSVIGKRSLNSEVRHRSGMHVLVVRGTLILSIVMGLSSQHFMAAENNPYVTDPVQYKQQRLQKLQPLLDEYHQGKRDDQDGYVILFEMVHLYASLHRGKEPQAQALLQELKALRVKHPEFNKMQTYELHESRDQRAKEQADMTAAQAKAGGFVPADSHVRQLYGLGNTAMAVYQYKLEFYKLPDGMELNEYLGNTFLFIGKNKVNKQEIRQITPSRVMKFTNRINVMPLTPTTTLEPVWICSDLINGYYAESKEERLILKAKGFTHGMPWIDKSAEFENFCGVLALTGEVIFRLPIEQSMPKNVVNILEVTDDGKKAALILGEAVTRPTEDEDVSVVGKVRQLIFWDYSNHLKKYDLPNNNPEVQGLIQKYGLQ